MLSTRLTKSYFWKGENQLECQVCHSPNTFKHIFIDCTCFTAARQLIHWKSFLKMLNLETLWFLLKVQTLRSYIKWIKIAVYWYIGAECCCVGTHDIHALILGRAITGLQAFTGDKWWCRWWWGWWWCSQPLNHSPTLWSASHGFNQRFYVFNGFLNFFPRFLFLKNVVKCKVWICKIQQKILLEDALATIFFHWFWFVT